MKIIAGMKSHKMSIAVVVIVLEFLGCLALLYTLRTGAAVVISRQEGFRFIPKEQNEEMKRLQSIVDGLMEKYDALAKTTVASEEYSRVVNENNRFTGRIRAMRDTAVAAGKLSVAEPLNTPEQVCMAMEQILRKPAETSKTGPAEVDMLISAVSNEISQRGVIDTKQPEKYGVGIYLIQKVLDAAGYPINEAGGIKSTCDAVVKFQGDKQLKQDGKVGMGTWTKVREFWSTKNTPGSLPLAQQPPVSTVARQPQPVVQSLQKQPQPAVQIQPGQPSSNMPRAIRRRQP